ncbi:MAG TPA: DUF1858 domain-containing protein [Pyrinomonadaceae bacterium]|nr:DUF1858 domain-containing protein [Pyrinomonadaceae bacterium]
MNKVDPITADAFLPDIVARYPSTRAVLDRYGLRGCGGPTGPREQLSWFARLHGVPIEILLREMNEAATQPPSQSAEFAPSLGDTIYRPFFLAGIATVLTLGCLWGAINLLMIGLGQSFTNTNYSWVLAHAHAVVFGFVGLFIMGFAYQAFPRFKHTTLWRPGLAFSALPLMIAGILLQTVAHLLTPPSLPLEIVAAIIQIAAVITFATVIVMTARRANKPEIYDRFVYAALGWFLLAAIANPVIFKLFELAGSRQQLLFNLATFNIPYRDVQLLGLAVVMILGVSLRFLPQAYALREPSSTWQAFLFWGVNGSILAGVVLFIFGMATGNHRLLKVQWLTTIVLLAVAIGTPRQFRLFGPVPENERDRGLKFIRAAYVWFIIAMAMLVFTPIYNFGIYMPLTGTHVPFSHAFFGAYRHALTVGFIMMMIVGVSSKVVPTLSGVDLRRAASLWPTFLLLNLGNLTRVSSQIATDFYPSAFFVMGFSGFIEVVGLTLWGHELFANMRAGRKLEKERSVSATKIAGRFEITPQTKVGDVLARYPQSLDIFLRYGFGPLSNPVLRKTMARVVTIEQACRREGVDLTELLSELSTISVSDRLTNSDVVVPITRIASHG